MFIGSYPRGIFDLVLGLDRWVARVAAYVLLMRDEYPPFRLDQGGVEESSALDAGESDEIVEPANRRRAARREHCRPHRARRRRHRRGHRRVRSPRRRLRSRRRRPDAARRRRLPHVADARSSRRRRTRSSPRAPTSTPDGAEWALDTFLGTVRITSDSGARRLRRHRTGRRGRPLSRGGRARRRHRLDSTGDPEYRRVAGGAPADPPTARSAPRRAARRSGPNRSSVAGEQIARLGARGRRLASRPHECRRVARRVVRHEHRRGARHRCSGSGSVCSSPAVCSRRGAAAAITAGARRRG